MNNIDTIIVIAAISFFALLWFIIPTKGSIGERKVSRILKRLPNDRYKKMDNVILSTPYGTSQIDHIIISIYGIFVIETKNYKGLIYGGEHSEYWTQNIYGNKYQFYNPILQNGGHIRVLKYQLSKFEPIKIIPIVAFSNDASIMFDTNDSIVINWYNIIKIIHCFDKIIMDTNKVNAIYDWLKNNSVKSTIKVRRKHIKNINRIKIQKRNDFDSGKCPRCGGRLVQRQGKYGTFYGCTNYPKCNFTCN